MNDHPTTERRLQLGVRRERLGGAWSPDEDSLRRWIDAALDSVARRDPELAAARRGATLTVEVLITDAAAMTDLNRRWRGRDNATNVLAFPALEPGQLRAAAAAGADAPPLGLGDIVVCARRVREEARELEREEEMHWAHLIVHASLHLLGFDHVSEHDARTMEPLETEIVSGELGFPPPYEPARP